MFWIDMLLALVFAWLLTRRLSERYGWTIPIKGDARGDRLFLFIVLFFGVWGIALTLERIGLALFGFPLVEFLIAGAILFLVLKRFPKVSAAHPRAEASHPEDLPPSAAASVLFGLVFWVMLMVLLIAAAARYL